MKICTRCEEEKSITEFYKRKTNKDGLDNTCKSCRKKDYKNWYASQGQKKLKLYGEEYRKRPGVKDMERNRRLKKTFGIDIEQYNSIFKQQNGKCAICNREENDPRHKFLSVDHNHKTGKIRALLCNLCNKGIGMLKEDINILQSAINYLNLHNT